MKKILLIAVLLFLFPISIYLIGDNNNLYQINTTDTLKLVNSGFITDSQIIDTGNMGEYTSGTVVGDVISFKEEAINNQLGEEFSQGGIYTKNKACTLKDGIYEGIALEVSRPNKKSSSVPYLQKLHDKLFYTVIVYTGMYLPEAGEGLGERHNYMYNCLNKKSHDLTVLGVRGLRISVLQESTDYLLGSSAFYDGGSLYRLLNLQSGKIELLESMIEEGEIQGMDRFVKYYEKKIKELYGWTGDGIFNEYQVGSTFSYIIQHISKSFTGEIIVLGLDENSERQFIAKGNIDFVNRKVIIIQ